MKNLINKIKEKIKNLVNQLQERISKITYFEKAKNLTLEYFEKLRESEIYQNLMLKYTSLDERQKKLFKIISISVGGLVVLLIISMFTGTLDSYTERIQLAEQVLRNTNSFLTVYDESKDEINRLNQTFKNDPDFSVKPFLEKIVNEAGIKKIDSIESKPTQEKDYFKNTRYDLKISNINLKQYLTFLYNIENSRYPLFVIATRMSRLKAIKYFDIELSILHKEFTQGAKNEQKK